MTQSLAGLLVELRSDLDFLPGLKRTYDDVPDSINETPSIVVYPRSGRYDLDTHGRGDGVYTFLGVHTVVIELHVERKDLERDMRLIEAFADALPVQLYRGFVTNRYNGTLLQPGDPRTANNATGAIRYQIVEGLWGSDHHIGHQIEFDVAIQQEVTSV